MTNLKFIDIVREKRLSLHLTQKDLAKSIPISKSAYSKIENHIQNPSFFIIKRLAELLDIDLNIIKEAPAEQHFFD